MGIPFAEPVETVRRDTNGYLCPIVRQRAPEQRSPEQNPFRRPFPLLPHFEDAEHDSIWTRNIRHRGEVLHTEAPEVSEDPQTTAELLREELPHYQWRAAERGLAYSHAEQARASEPAAEPARRRLPHPDDSFAPEDKPHKFRLRFGYDPRIFLEDPRMRGQLLSEEAEKWAATYREKIPMCTDPQLARRNIPEHSRYLQSGVEVIFPRSYVRGGVVEHGPPSDPPSVSDLEDEDTSAPSMRERIEALRQRQQERHQEQPLTHISNILLNGVSPNDYTSRVEDRLAVLGQALRSSSARNIGVQAAVNPGPTRTQATGERVYDLNHDLGRMLRPDNLRRTNPRRTTRIHNYLQRQVIGNQGSSDDTPDPGA